MNLFRNSGMASSFLFFTACTTLNIAEIENLHRSNFEPWALKPVVEPTGLRIDVLRQTDSYGSGDSTGISYEFERDYHSFGFDLGNGLIYDLNKNLSLDISYLLKYSGASDFELDFYRRSGNREKLKRYTYHNHSLTSSNAAKPRNRMIFQVTHLGDSMLYKTKPGPWFSVFESDSSLVYKRRFTRDEINFSNPEELVLYVNKRKGIKYQESGNKIILGKDYLVTLDEDNSIIRLKAPRGKNRTMISIIKGENVLYIFDKNFHGKKIEIKDNKLFVYYDHKLGVEYSINK